MKINHISKSTFTIFFVLVVAMTLSACGGRASTVASGWTGISADEDTAYVAFNAHVVAVNLANGTERWRFPTEADPKISFYADPALTETGKLIIGGYDNVLYSIDIETGAGVTLFEGAEGRYIGGSLATSDRVFAPSADHKLYAVDLIGHQLWQFETGEPLWAKPAADPDCNCIYLSSMDHKIYAIDAQSGVQVWSTEDLGGSIVGTPSISEDMVLYAGTFANEMVAIDAENGRVLWRFGADDWVWASPTLDGDTLYFGDLSGTLYAVDRQNGVSKWQIQPGGAIVGTPLVTNDGIYFTTEDGQLVSVNSVGAVRWTQLFEMNLHSRPIVSGDTILVATSDPENLLIAFDSNGVRKWSFALVNK
jgi:outer membrane protein assembly factor BamB